MDMVVFSIQREIAENYYYKVELMKRFFLDMLKKPDSANLMKQWGYIAESFPFKEWVEKHSPLKEAAVLRINGQLPFFDYGETCGIMNHKNYCCQFQCEDLWQAEAMVLEPLRKSAHSFFILETSGKHYGWLSPLAGQQILL
ncbi:sporulation inhibitor of replication protein SirA [Halobacillus litoralis]|uniref:sporulation inhibitor of replication protein SirA n=1 Tax=Halobacillus litoralis TaxID=45668 RepID=UPI001CD690FB|nr:sporulation inhibitor of replication protein SirA [Halobacillus litoralis]MCA0969040.1 sporulation inhibitor of replication protein SirA [Halobacillus litoralis]